MESWNVISYHIGHATKNVAVDGFDLGPLVGGCDRDQGYLTIIGKME